VQHVVFIGERGVITERMYVITPVLISRHLSIRNPSFYLRLTCVPTDQVFDVVLWISRGNHSEVVFGAHGTNPI